MLSFTPDEPEVTLKTREFEVLSDAGNAVVARDTGRRYPGVLIQGDSLRVLLDFADELVEGVQKGDLEAAKECSVIIQQRIRDFLEHYERVLAGEGWEIPYEDRVLK